MDVNFDGEDELVIEHPGYNRRYFACFDLVHGEPDIAPGILTSIDEAPYNNIVASENGCTFTEFDFNKKSIHIFEQLGCCASVETWCEYESANEWWKPKVVVVKKIRRETNSEGTTVKTYTRQNDELKLLNTTLERF